MSALSPGWYVIRTHLHTRWHYVGVKGRTLCGVRHSGEIDVIRGPDLSLPSGELNLCLRCHDWLKPTCAPVSELLWSPL